MRSRGSEPRGADRATAVKCSWCLAKVFDLAPGEELVLRIKGRNDVEVRESKCPGCGANQRIGVKATEQA